MGPGRRFGGWTTVGALAGYFVSFLWLLFLVVRPDCADHDGSTIADGFLHPIQSRIEI